MSLILDALRKMEQERKSRLHNVDDIRPEVLGYRGIPAKPVGNRLIIPLSAVIILLVLCIAGWFLLQDGGKRPDIPPREPAQSKTTVPEPPSAIQPTPQDQKGLSPDLVIPATVVTLPQPSPSQPVNPPTTMMPDPGTTAGITISGIAYQDDRVMRRAVINGALVGEGAEISGSRILEIRENSIRFSKNGQSFELTYSSSLGR